MKLIDKLLGRAKLLDRIASLEAENYRLKRDRGYCDAHQDNLREALRLARLDTALLEFREQFWKPTYELEILGVKLKGDTYRAVLRAHMERLKVTVAQ